MKLHHTLPLGLPQSRSASFRHWILAAVGAAGLAAACAGLWLTGRVVLEMGGACASGGPYVVANECPDGVGLWGAAAMPAMFMFGPLLAWGAGRIHDRAAWLPLAAWPVLFLTLGFSFFAAAFGGQGDTGGWIVCGVVFVLLGAPGLVAVRELARLARRQPALMAVVALGAAAGVALAAVSGPTG